MARRYQPSELLQLRDSPLVVKPDNLPPIEEWMGPPPDPPLQKKASNSREQSTQQDTANRRSSLFESRHISRGSTSEDIVLGPPRTSFASASRGLGKSNDTTDRSSTKINETDDQKQDRYNFRDKFFKDRDVGDRDSDRRDTKSGLTNGRRAGRDDREDWPGGRTRRTFGTEESERRPRRNGDSERWEMRDHREHPEGGNDRAPRDKESGRYPPRRDGQGRGKHDNWFRDGETKDSVDGEAEKTPVRHREWRRGPHGGDRDWNRSAKHEQEPEWLDSTDRDGPKETHTQADFQRWKERMKAGSVQASQEDKKEVSSEQMNTESKPRESSKRLDGEIFGTLDPSLMDPGLDKFFGLWSENKQIRDHTPEIIADGNTNIESLPAKVTKASRFAGIFNPPSETANREPEPQTIIHTEQVRPASTDADQEGFQRILAMLGGNKSMKASPQVEGSRQQEQSEAPLPQPDHVRSPTTMSSPVRESFLQQEYASLNSPRDRPPPGLEALFVQKPKNPPGPNLDTEFLLRLMQQSKISSSNHQNNPPPPGASLQTTGSMNVQDMHARVQVLEKQKSPVFLDDPAIANIRRPEPQDPRDHLRRRTTNGIVMGYIDDMGFPPSQGNQTPNPAPGVRPPRQPPMALQRPPGFERVTPPGWPNQQPQPPGPNQFMLPPGLAQPPNRNMHPNFPAAPPLPLHATMPPPNDRQAYQRNAIGGGPPPFAPPPGMMPPPGYMNSNAPPPAAFPPMPHTPDGMMSMSHGNAAQYGGLLPQGPPQSSSRQLFDMLGPLNGDGSTVTRNGAGMMGPYR
ncbi:conserved hypothetical protein [Histoplasma capsulatum G186AR]|uniref:Uncharacterized protein n=2 Tax=Ajellomyces capsulatus TaxID=5037 RepID=C0NP74_AJECG|nr:uncharacterized protein HCBG_04954 [Histoplasma capsulatum G186AR]EEH06734.1 conserved hypothetical protein [Histoplasma capsulatum G186AR]KAG5304734.1 hypothetical protein I7I52_03169 [Histoplasma capsulatum]QSS75693.1 hypothetical protein I7I50_04911 [Histoplasma capsulatum G186AR]